MEEQDQWKQGGDCNVCRRATYCHNKCRARKEKSNQELQANVGKCFVRAYERIIMPEVARNNEANYSN